MNAELRQAADGLSASLVQWRRHLHAYPELSGEERETARFVADRLRELGLSPQTDVGGMHGVIADLPGGDGPHTALRADMDALPITEENDWPHASTRPGVMHACGHDAHTAMLLGAATLLTRPENLPPGPVRLIFQPHEEKEPGGAQAMIAAGALDDVDRIYGLHVWSQLSAGRLGVRSGPFMASPTRLDIQITGKGGHAAMPQTCVDPVVIAAEVVTALQSVVSRSVGLAESAVVSITQMRAGSAHNVIPGSAWLGGTIRTYDDAVRTRVIDRIRQIVDHVAAAHGGSARVEVEYGYPPLVNDADRIAALLKAAEQAGFDASQLVELPPQGGAEDFAYYCQRVPGAFAFLGAGNEEQDCTFPHHHSRFNIDESVLPAGAAVLAQCALLP